MHFIGKSFPDGTPYIANPQKYYGDLAAAASKGGVSKGMVIVHCNPFYFCATILLNE
jgi:hypothetical protein